MSSRKYRIAINSNGFSKRANRPSGLLPARLGFDLVSWGPLISKVLSHFQIKGIYFEFIFEYFF